MIALKVVGIVLLGNGITLVLLTGRYVWECWRERRRARRADRWVARGLEGAQGRKRVGL